MRGLFLVLLISVFGVAAAPLGAHVTLRGGVIMPSVGLGSSGSCHPDPDGTERNCSQYVAVSQALALGYRSFHGALSYGNQAGTGAALKDSNIPRDELFVMSMVPKYLMGYNETKAAVAASLAQLQVEFIDLMMVHHRAADIAEWPRSVANMNAFPDGWARPGSPNVAADGESAVWQPPACALADPTWLACQDGTWQALAELKAAGKLRAIGVSNWMVSNLKRMVLLGQELPAVNQIEQHIGWHDSEMVEYCVANGIVVQAATPLARSMKELVEVGGHPVVSAIASKYKKSPAQISLKYLLEMGVSPIPSAKNPAYQKENLDLFKFELSPGEVKELGKIALLCRKHCTSHNGTSYYCHKCWGDPGALMCGGEDGSMFHCP